MHIRLDFINSQQWGMVGKSQMGFIWLYGMMGHPLSPSRTRRQWCGRPGNWHDIGEEDESLTPTSGRKTSLCPKSIKSLRHLMISTYIVCVSSAWFRYKGHLYNHPAQIMCNYCWSCALCLSGQLLVLEDLDGIQKNNYDWRGLSTNFLKCVCHWFLSFLTWWLSVVDI